MIQSPFERSLEIVNALEDVQLTETQLEELQKATAEDKVLPDVIRAVKQGWPSERKDVPPDLRPYFHHRDELVESSGILFRGTRCVIPIALRSQVLRKIHCAHTGIEGCMRLARDCVFWPGMTAQIKNMVEICDVCQARSKKQQKETLRPTDIPELPWTLVAADLFQFGSDSYLITVDYYSSF